MPDPTATVHIDGGARGNPGPASYAFSLERPGLPVVEEAQPIGKATNNVAEYTGLIRALEAAAELGVKDLNVFSDSELLVKQMNGEYRVKNADLQDLYREAQELRKRFDRVTLMHVRRAQNARADFLCNEALDGRPVRAGDSPPPIRAWNRQGEPEASAPGWSDDAAAKGNTRALTPPARLVSSSRAPEALEEEAIALLNAAQKAWTAGKDSPNAVEVWDRLWAMLHEHVLLTKANR